mmetsp:Transcript_67486/g.106844  ORF Transcript_67486/g.106844 Transcript_67486/m.106844 type:complete len:212 (+) Transcript_67486:190-825(+)
MLIGGRTHCLSVTVDANSISASKEYSCFPGKRFIFQTMAPCVGSCFALVPLLQLAMWPLAVFFGHGNLIVTFAAEMFRSYIAVICKLSSSRFRPNTLTWGNNLKGLSMFSVIRYVISSNSPSGGINVISRSTSNLDSRTHWWKRKSSNATPFGLWARCWSVDDTINLSFNPNLHSGMPDSLQFTCILPDTSALSLSLLADINMLTFSTTSM